VIARHASSRLPADISTPVCAYSLNRKIRESYVGPFFRYRQGGEEYDYPNITPDGDAYIVKIYDQKLNNDIELSDAYQPDMELQPKLSYNGYYSASFSHMEYLLVDAVIGGQITVLCASKGSNVLYPVVGLGEYSISVSDKALSVCHSGKCKTTDTDGCFSVYSDNLGNYENIHIGKAGSRLYKGLLSELIICNTPLVTGHKILNNMRKYYDY